uniref:Elicitor peptide 1 n=1 Tax=Noccaea caerulescens TaxID=107243 RepID=A0A1J3HYW3_NOCCA
MEKERRNEEETYRCFSFQFLDQILKASLKCFGLLHHDSPPTTTKTASYPVPLNQPEEEEEENVGVKDHVVVTPSGSKNGVVVTSRVTKFKAKMKEREKVSTGRSGQHN